MNIRILPEKDFKKSNFGLICLLTNKEKAFGNLPAEPQTNLQIKEILKKIALKEYSDQIEILAENTTPILICALPKKKGLDRRELIRLAAFNAVQTIKSRCVTTILFLANKTGKQDFAAIAEGALAGTYKFLKYKTDKKAPKLKEIVFLSPKSMVSSFRQTAERAQVIHQGITACRNLINEPGGSLPPKRFAESVGQLVKGSGLSVETKDYARLRKEGFNGLLMVGKGSMAPPCMITVSWRGAGKSTGKDKQHLVLVGKGVTFDTGGISLKPSADMWEMKSDMSGAATALAAVLTMARLKLKINASAVLVIAENRPGLKAVLPGDIFKAKNGKSVMVENTDAEGRLILTDGLAQAGILKATHIVDIATLTGAIVRALGTSIAGLFCNNADLVRKIKAAGKVSGEKFWEMPLEPEYESFLEDPVADIKNIGKPEAGAISAALFLQAFVPDKTVWAHLDIAGTAFTTRTWKYCTPGATGWGLKTMVALASSLADQA